MMSAAFGMICSARYPRHDGTATRRRRGVIQTIQFFCGDARRTVARAVTRPSVFLPRRWVDLRTLFIPPFSHSAAAFGYRAQTAAALCRHAHSQGCAACAEHEGRRRRLFQRTGVQACPDARPFERWLGTSVLSAQSR